MAEMVPSLKARKGSGPELLGVIRFEAGPIVWMWWAQKVVLMRSFDGKLFVTPNNKRTTRSLKRM